MQKLSLLRKTFLGKGPTQNRSYFKYTTSLLRAILRKTILAITQTKNMFTQFIAATFIYVPVSMYSTDNEMLGSVTYESLSPKSQNVMS